VQNKWERIDKSALDELVQSQRIQIEALKNESRVLKAERASMQQHLQTLNLQNTRGKSNAHTHTTHILTPPFARHNSDDFRAFLSSFDFRYRILVRMDVMVQGLEVVVDAGFLACLSLYMPWSLGCM